MIARLVSVGLVLASSFILQSCLSSTPVTTYPDQTGAKKTGALRSHHQVWGYFPNYSNHPDTRGVPSVVALSRLSHLLYFSVGLKDNFGNINTDQLVGNLRLKALLDSSALAGTKVILVVGGAGVSTAQFGAVSKDPAARANFAEQLVTSATNLGFHGVDIDWEFPNEFVGDNYRLMLETIKNRMAGTGLKLSVAVHPFHLKRYPNVYGPNFCQAVDYVGLMTYDLGIPHAPATAVDHLPEWAAGAGCRPDQLVLGLAFYGKVNNAGTNTMSYAKLADAGCDLNADQCGSHDYNGILTTLAKTKYVVDNNYGGVMIWEMNQDLPTWDPRSLLMQLTSILPQQ